MTRERTSLAKRFADRVRRHGGLEDGDTVVVGVSGGVDSVVLLHLLRFCVDRPRLRLVAAHVDHAMRPGSAADAAWVRGLGVSWGVEVRTVRLDPAPTTEAEARRRRYAFLEEVRLARSARLSLTAHHADDQAETVLFRVLRGTGIRGLQGIRERRAPALWRPLLPFTRREISEHARAAGLSWREDPTNRDPFVRNVIRHRLLPAAEDGVAPGARRALAGLARRAREEEEAWHSLAPTLLAGAGLGREGVEVSLDAEAFSRYGPAVRARLLRHLARTLGSTLREAGTRSAVEFSSSGGSGREVQLGGGLTLRRDLGRLVLGRARPEGSSAGRVRIEAPTEGEARFDLQGASYRVGWACARGEEGKRCAAFAVAALRFPLEVRAWAPGDRARLSYGSKKLKKLFLEARVPPWRRHRIPVLADATGAVLWVPDVVRSVDAPPEGDGGVLFISITDADSD
jgi:tRNA(Ile)-lysidine synthase